MEKVKKLVEAGLSIPSAVKEALGMPVTEFAAKYGIHSAHVSSTINGGRRPTEGILGALIAELGGTEYEWRMLFWEAGKPEPSNAT
jgi:plasmid maintenance system antidote protein VapI